MKRFVLARIVLILLLFETGCLSSAIIRERRLNIEKISLFDSECSAMRIIAQDSYKRYKLQGCGYIYIYSCHDRVNWTGDSDIDAVNLVLTGGLDPDAPCRLERAFPIAEEKKDSKVQSVAPAQSTPPLVLTPEKKTL